MGKKVTVDQLDSRLKDISYYDLDDEEGSFLYNGESITDNIVNKLKLSAKGLVSYIGDLGTFIVNRKEHLSNTFLNATKKIGGLTIIRSNEKLKLNDKDAEFFGARMAIYNSAGVDISIPDKLDENYSAIVGGVLDKINRNDNFRFKLPKGSDPTLGKSSTKILDLVESGKIILDGKLEGISILIYVSKDKIKVGNVNKGKVSIISGKIKKSIYEKYRIREVCGDDFANPMDENSQYSKIFFSKGSNIVGTMTNLREIIKEIESGILSSEDEAKLLVYIKEFNTLIKIGSILIDFIQDNIDTTISLSSKFSFIQAREAQKKAVEDVK